MAFNIVQIPKAASKHILKFYIDHKEIMIHNTSSRCMSTNAERNRLYEMLSAEIKNEFGISLSKKQVKNHFNHIRSKVFEKASRHRKQEAQERRYRLQTGGGVDHRLEERFASSPPVPFDDPMERELWAVFCGTPVDVGTSYGVTPVGSHAAQARSIYGRPAENCPQLPLQRDSGTAHPRGERQNEGSYEHRISNVVVGAGRVGESHVYDDVQRESPPRHMNAGAAAQDYDDEFEIESLSSYTSLDVAEGAGRVGVSHGYDGFERGTGSRDMTPNEAVGAGSVSGSHGYGENVQRGNAPRDSNTGVAARAGRVGGPYAVEEVDPTSARRPVEGGWVGQGREGQSHQPRPYLDEIDEIERQPPRKRRRLTQGYILERQERMLMAQQRCFETLTHTFVTITNTMQAMANGCCHHLCSRCRAEIEPSSPSPVTRAGLEGDPNIEPSASGST